NGLQIQKVYENGAVNSYEYNDDNQVIKVTKSGGEIINYEMIDSLDRVETPLLTRGSSLQRALNAKSLSLTVAKYANERVTKCSSYISRRRSRPRQINASTFALGYESEPKIVEKCFTVTKRRWVEEEIDPLGFKEIKNYDNNGNLSIQIDPTNRGKRNFYDQRGNLVRTSNYIDLRADQKFDYDTTFNQILQVKDYLGRITSFDQDENGNIIRVVDPLGQVTSLAYNSKGQVVSIVDYLGQETQLRYDLQSGNLVEVIDPKGSVTKSQYDLDGNLIQITDPMGQVTQFQYNEMNRVIKTIAADFSETSFTYDVNGNLLTVNDPRNGVTTFVYDERDRVIERVDPKNQKEEFLYDEEGLLFSKKDRNNLVTFYEYNDKNLLTNRILESGKEYVYEYDEAGRVLSIDDSQNSITYTYDEVGRVKTTSFEGANQPTFTLENEYDFNGNRTTLKTSEGDFVYSYDELNRLKTVENPNNLVFETVYDSIGRRAEMIIPNGTKVGYDYDKANRIKEISHLNGSTNLATFNYGYDDNGNITSVNTSRSALSNLSPTLSYTYDAINQLISATNPIQGQVDETFNYDNLGNRLRNQNQTQDAVYDESNRLLENQTHTYTYDLEGNMTSKEDKGTGFLTQYTWDEENQLIQIIERNSISTPATKTVNYVYDVLGRRIEKSVDGVITRYIYDNEDILFELDGNNQITKVFTHGGGIDEPLSFEDKLAQQTYFYHADHLGSIIGLSNSSGNLVQNYVYDSFGNVSIFDGSGTSFNLGSEPIKQPYGYTSRELDAESDLYYYRARYYNSSIGRFISEDPIKFSSGDENLYRYVESSPIINIDPTGFVTQCQVDAVKKVFSDLFPRFKTVKIYITKVYGLDGYADLSRSEIYVNENQSGNKYNPDPLVNLIATIKHEYSHITDHLDNPDLTKPENRANYLIRHDQIERQTIEWIRRNRVIIEKIKKECQKCPSK
ncbi:MAG: hypothetical protein NXH75_06640, partial [Halobacteriovoraceae bacterium]|nr:hypothetical protein [Halobacteriovoraceae bacterium]